MPATRRARAAAAEREVKRRAAHEVSVERTRLVGKLDVGVLSVIAGFGGKRELWGVALAFKEHGVEILASEPTLDAILLASRGDTVLRKTFRPKPGAQRQRRFGGSSFDRLRVDSVDRFDANLAALNAWKDASFTIGRLEFPDDRAFGDSPRKLLPDACALLEARLQDPTASVAGTMKKLQSWQASLNATRWARAKAAARAAAPNCPEEDLWAHESDCMPFEYDGPATASNSGMGGCAIA